MLDVLLVVFPGHPGELHPIYTLNPTPTLGAV